MVDHVVRHVPRVAVVDPADTSSLVKFSLAWEKNFYITAGSDIFVHEEAKIEIGFSACNIPVFNGNLGLLDSSVNHDDRSFMTVVLIGLEIAANCSTGFDHQIEDLLLWTEEGGLEHRKWRRNGANLVLHLHLPPVVDDLMLIFTRCVGSNMDDENKSFTFASTFDLREVSTIWMGQYHVIVVGVLLDKALHFHADISGHPDSSAANLLDFALRQGLMNFIWIKLPDRPAWSSPSDVLLSDGEVVESNLGVIERHELLGQCLVLGQVAEASVVHTKVYHLHTIMAAEISAAITVRHVEDTFSVGPSGTLTKFASSCTLSSGWSLGRHVGNLTTLVAHDSHKMEEAHSESGTLAACQLVPLSGVEHLAVSICHPPLNLASNVETTW